MKLGQTSFVYFLSRLTASALGFVATIYFARLLGAEPLGIYYLVLGIVSWLGIVGKIGISGAISKRVSEGEQREQYAAAGASFIMTLFVMLAIVLFLFRSYVDSYVGYPATGYVVLILLVTLSYSIVSSLLTGVHLVHVRGILSPIKIGGRSLLQVGAVAAGLGLAGLFLGYVAGLVIVIALGGVFAFRRLQEIKRPRKLHFRSLFDYAKFAWLGSLQSRMFNYTDVLVLGFFVSSTLIGIYAIAWNIAQFLIVFAGAISSTLFPEMSELSAEGDPQVVANLVEDALSYAGLLLIPGLVGSVIIGERLLRIYGDEFTQGATILGILIGANLLMSYQNQILNTLNAIDRPDLSFRANILFIIANLLLNIVLVYLYGWVGAAVATTLSVTISLAAGYRYLNLLVDFIIPYYEITYQWIAALLMGVIVYAIREFGKANWEWIVDSNAVFVVFLVSFGAAVYFLILFAISQQFRTTVDRNLPVGFPLVRGK